MLRWRQINRGLGMQWCAKVDHAGGPSRTTFIQTHACKQRLKVFRACGTYNSHEIIPVDLGRWGCQKSWNYRITSWQAGKAHNHCSCCDLLGFLASWILGANKPETERDRWNAFWCLNASLNMKFTCGMVFFQKRSSKSSSWCKYRPWCRQHIWCT